MVSDLLFGLTNKLSRIYSSLWRIACYSPRQPRDAGFFDETNQPAGELSHILNIAIGLSYRHSPFVPRMLESRIQQRKLCGTFGVNNSSKKAAGGTSSRCPRSAP